MQYTSRKSQSALGAPLTGTELSGAMACWNNECTAETLPCTASKALRDWKVLKQVPNRSGSQSKAAYHETLVKSFPACVASVQGDNPSAHAFGLKRCLIQLITSCQPGPRAPEGADGEQAQALQVRLHCCAVPVCLYRYIYRYRIKPQADQNQGQRGLQFAFYKI